jgi:calcineurin-like phosphoesterase
LLRRYTDERLIPSTGNGTIFGIVIETDDATGLAKSITQIKCE